MLKAQRKVYVPFRHAQFLLRPNAVSPSSPLDLIKLLKLSADTKTVKVGKTIHSHLIVTSQATENNIIEVNSLINFYAKVNQVSIAHNLFDRMPDRNVVSWSALMTGYLLNGFSLKVIRLLKDMISEGNVSPNEYIFAIAISSCCDRGRVEEGRQCHGLLLKTGFSFHNYVRNALVSMYSKCSIVQDAMGVWNEVPVNDIVAYNSILSRLVENGYLREGLEVLRSMVSESVKWDKVTFVNAFSLCASLKDLRLGLHVHGKMLTSDVECDAYVSSAIITMYGKCGKSLMARGVFDGLQSRNVVLWTAVMASYFQNGCFEEALNLFSKMEQENVKSNEFTYAVLLNACAGLSARRNGSLLHGHSEKSGFKHHVMEKRWDGVVKVRKLMRDKKIKKEPGVSWIEIGNVTHIFTSEDNKHPDYGQTYQKVKELLAMIKPLGYTPDIGAPPWWLQDIEHVRSPTRAIMGHGNHALL
ncbi:hypothetical protein D5086_030641 [Populus alba]|uniref:Uncharacterized protein n=1 Tax=Populus alba TaxID=43335 RepID=A0ACC4AP69_POPAL